MSPTRHALREDLTRIGAKPTPGPSPAFTARLERQLVGHLDPSAGATVLARPRRRRHIMSILTAAAATVAIVVLGGALLGVFGQGGNGSLQLATAKDTTVFLPGGQAVPGHTGLSLPDGTVVRTGPNGRAAAGSVELGPGLQGVVDAGTLRPQPVPPASVPGLTTPTTPPVNIPPVTLPGPPFGNGVLPTLPPLGGR